MMIAFSAVVELLEWQNNKSIAIKTAQVTKKVICAVVLAFLVIYDKVFVPIAEFLIIDLDYDSTIPHVAMMKCHTGGEANVARV